MTRHKKKNAQYDSERTKEAWIQKQKKNVYIFN